MLAAIARRPGSASGRRPRRRAGGLPSHATREVSRYLGNTPTVCRDSYIDPRVFECFYDGRTIDLDLDAIGEDVGEPELKAAEEAVLEMISRRRR